MALFTRPARFAMPTILDFNGPRMLSPPLQWTLLTILTRKLCLFHYNGLLRTPLTIESHASTPPVEPVIGPLPESRAPISALG